MRHLDEVTFLVELLKGGNITSTLPTEFTDYNTSYDPDITDNWAGSAEIVFGQGNGATKAPTPNVVDIRNLTRNTAKRYDLSSGDLIVVFEDSQNVEYPTTDYSVRNETYTLTMHIRTLTDERDSGDGNFGRDRLRNLYKVVRHRIETHRRGATITDVEALTMNQMFLGSRSESNDKAKRLYGYKVSVEIKKFAIAIP